MSVETLLSEESLTRLIELSTDAAEKELLSMYRTFKHHESFMVHLDRHLAHLNDMKNLYQQLKEVLEVKQSVTTGQEFTEPDRIGNKGDKHE